MILFLIVILIISILIKIALRLIVKKYGKFSYDGFSAAGFAYNSEKDIFYSTKNAWQKNFGYTHTYDVLAPLFRIIIDTEPIRFKYNNKNWLIAFWKGQYGIVTGAEVGIYCTSEQKINKRTVYFSVSDNEMLNISLILYKNDKIISKVNATHWWLAIFKLGMFSKPKELTMDINITFPNSQMLYAFLNAFKKLGYKEKHYSIIDNTFCFKYIKPRTHKVWTKIWPLDPIRQFFNRKNVELYNEYLNDLIENNKIDDSITPQKQNLIMVSELIPELLKNDSKNSPHTAKIIDKNKKNVILLNDDIYSEIRANRP